MKYDYKCHKHGSKAVKKSKGFTNQDRYPNIYCDKDSRGKIRQNFSSIELSLFNNPNLTFK